MSPSSLRILMTHPSSDLYGSDLQLIESLDALVDAGHSVKLLMPNSGPLDSLAHRATVDHRAFTVLRKSMLTFGGLTRLSLTALPEMWRLLRFLRSTKPDVLYVNTITLPLWVIAGRLAKVPTLVHVHEAAEGGRLARLIHLPLLFAGEIIANSRTTRDALLRLWPSLRHRTSVIYNGVPDYGSNPASSPIDDLVVVIGRLSPRKGVHIALEAVAMLRQKGVRIQLHVAGTPFFGYEWYEKSLRQRAEREDLRGSVTFLGYVRPIHQLLERASIVVVPSYGESFGNIAVEAMLAARPVVASRVPGLVEVLGGGAVGRLFKVGDPESLATELNILLSDPTGRGRLAREGRDLAVRAYGIEEYRIKIVDRVQDLAQDQT